MSKIIACCGLVCIECPTFIPTQNDDDEAKARTAAFYKKNTKLIIKTTGSHADSFDHRWATFGSGSNRPGDREAVLFALTQHFITLEKNDETNHPS